MKTAIATRNIPRWTTSFADLCLVLLAFLLLLQAHRGDSAALGAGIRAAFGGKGAAETTDRPAAPMFEPGEAMLVPHARDELAVIGRAAAARGATVRIESRGADGAGRRFDRWDLAAARAAAIARGVAAGGLEPGRIDLAVAGTAGAQRVRVVVR